MGPFLRCKEVSQTLTPVVDGIGIPKIFSVCLLVYPYTIPGGRDVGNLEITTVIGDVKEGPIP